MPAMRKFSLLAALSAPGVATVASTGPHAYLLRHDRRLQPSEKSEKTNDDEHVVIPLLPFSLVLTNVPASSSTALADAFGTPDDLGTPAGSELLEYITDMGSRTFQESEAYGERFVEWDAGEVKVGDFWGAALAESRSGNIFDRRLEETGTTVVTLAENGSATFSGAYWGDNPGSDELTNFLVSGLNSDANKDELLGKLRPVVCSPEDVAGGTCNLEMEFVASDADGAATSVGAADSASGVSSSGGANGGVSGNASSGNASNGNASGSTATDSNGQVSSGSQGAATQGKGDMDSTDASFADWDSMYDESFAYGDGIDSTDVSFADWDADADAESLAVGSAALGEAQDPSQMGGDGEAKDTTMMIILIAVGGVLVLLLATVLYARRRRRRRNLANNQPWNDDEGKGNGKSSRMELQV